MALSDIGLSPPPRLQSGNPVDRDAIQDDPILAVRHDSDNCSAVVVEFPTVPP